VYAAALCIALAYYAGAKLGLALTFDPYPVAILWPPNAILMAALLITPVRLWHILVLAAFPAHVLAELEGGVPLLMVLCWFVSNISEALIAAAGMRWLLGRVPAFDKLQDIGAFVLIAAFLAPFLSSFIDAAFVRWMGWGEVGYWQLWGARFTSNILAAFVIVPFVVSCATTGWRRLREMVLGKLPEGLLLMFGLLATGVMVFAAPLEKPEMLPALLYLPLPFLLWSAVRFGPVGSSTAFMIIALIVIWGAGHGRGPFLGGLPGDNALSVQMFLIFVGTMLLLLSASVEERRRSEHLLRSNNERFDLVLRATNDVIFDWDMTADQLWWNKNGDIFFGRLSDKRETRFSAWSALLHPEDRDRAISQVQGAMDTGGQTFEAEYRLRRRYGGYANVNSRGFIVQDGEGKPCRVIGSLIDITDRKRAEEANQQLAHASRLAILGELTASIAHEINQPLTAILANADAAEVLLDQKIVRTEELKQILHDIHQDDLRASDVIKRIRTLVKKSDLVMRPFDMNHAIREVLKLVNADLTRQKVKAETRLEPIPLLYGDEIYLQQVLLNLIINAMEAMSETSDPDKRFLGIETQCTETGYIEVTVWDSGTGIAPDAQERLFESFFTTKPQGMGLGLSISRSLIKAHRGDIRASVRPGGGGCFTFYLPTDTGARNKHGEWHHEERRESGNLGEAATLDDEKDRA
jgi:two-component system sensor kinase FixL